VKNREINRQIQAFNSLKDRALSACGDSTELRSEWARYLCIIASGILENAIAELYSEFAKQKFAEPAARFVSETVSRIQNPKTEKFLNVTGAFNASWKDKLEAYCNENGRGDAINSIMGQRHLIAHGRYKDSTISIARVDEYFKKSVEVLEFIERQAEH
jgi:hypothetical protein